MRKIMFKAKRKDTSEWIYWNIYGELCRESGKRERLSIKKGATTHYYDYINQVYQIIDIKTICQYTGLTDKNRRKIWENDIVKCNYDDYGDKGTYIGKVFFREDTCTFLVTDMKSTNYEWWNEDKEVIGNIFDNLELLGGQ